MYLLSNMAMLGIHVSFLVGAISTIIIHPTKVIITADQSPRPNLATKRRQTLATWLGSTSNMAWRKKSDGSKVDSLRAGGPQESVLTEWLGGPYKFGWNNPTYSFFLRLGFVEFFFCTTGFIAIKITSIWENMFGTFSKHRSSANPR